ncbi:MAG: phosphoethanolamine transferase [Chitinophagales bacterium]
MKKEKITFLNKICSVLQQAFEGFKKDSFYYFVFFYFSLISLVSENSTTTWQEAIGLLVRVCTMVILCWGLVSTLRFLIPIFKYRKVLFQVAVWGILIVHVFICTADLFLLNYYEQNMSKGLAFVLFETNKSDIFEFLEMHNREKSWAVYFYLALPAIAYWIFQASFFDKIRASIGHFFFASLIAMTALFIISPIEGFVSMRALQPTLTFLRAIPEYQKELKAYQEIADNVRDFNLEHKVKSISPSKKNLTVIIMGESTSRTHMSLYGYPRPTSPLLEKMRGDLYIFDDVMSPHSHTVPTLKKVLTYFNKDNEGNWYDYPTLFDIFKASSSKTYWISNQETFGIWARFGTVLGNQADVAIFHDRVVSSRDFRKTNAYPPDGVLLSYLEKVIQNDTTSNQLIILHLMGTHGWYDERYPENFSRFNHKVDSSLFADRPFLDSAKKNIVDSYDNAVLYNDWVVSEMIKIISKKKDYATAVLYLSDHGEEVYEYRDMFGHNEISGSIYMIEIPFFIWLSDTYKEKKPKKVNHISNSIHCRYMSDDLIHTILDLSDLRHEMWDSTRSVINPAFDSTRKRIYAGKEY